MYFLMGLFHERSAPKWGWQKPIYKRLIKRRLRLQDEKLAENRKQTGSNLFVKIRSESDARPHWSIMHGRASCESLGSEGRLDTADSHGMEPNDTCYVNKFLGLQVQYILHHDILTNWTYAMLMTYFKNVLLYTMGHLCSLHTPSLSRSPLVPSYSPALVVLADH